MIKSLALIALLFVGLPVTASQESPIIVELYDHKFPTRRLIVRANHEAEFKEATGGRIYRFSVEFEKAGKCKLIINHIESTEPQTTLTVEADSCLWIGTATLSGTFQGEEFSWDLFDVTTNKPPKK